jgi:Zn-dependent protease
VSPEILSLIHEISAWAVPILIAITFHEAAHAYAAWKLGDDTAHRLGRVSFNPLRHMDLFGTVLLPALLLLTRAPFLFGWAKPVPVAYRRLRQPRRGMVIVALAGPASNLALALVSVLLIQLAGLLPEVAWVTTMLKRSVLINLILAIFNMIPVPPLDGGRILIGLLPPSLARHLVKLERYGLVLIIVLFLLLPVLGRQVGMDLNLLRWLLAAPLAWLSPILS